MKNIILLLFLLLLVSCETYEIHEEGASLEELNIDIQAHRGGMGLMPENTIEAMIKAIDLGATTLEFDLQMSKDSMLVVCHDRYMNSDIILKPDGSEIEKSQEGTYLLSEMPYDSIAQYIIGLKYWDSYPLQKKISCKIPLLTTLIDTVEAYTKKIGRDPIDYSIEIKHDAMRDLSEQNEYIDLIMKVLAEKKLGDRVTIQSFQSSILNYLHEQYPAIRLSYIITEGLEKSMSRLNFVPDVISPTHLIVDSQFMTDASSFGMDVVVWPVDVDKDIKRLILLDVDGIITNYPNWAIKSVCEMDSLLRNN